MRKAFYREGGLAATMALFFNCSSMISSIGQYMDFFVTSYDC